MTRRIGATETTRPVSVDARVAADRQRSRAHTRKMTPEERREAAAAYWAGKANLRQLAAEYGVSQGRMSQIVRTFMPHEPPTAAPRNALGDTDDDG